MIPSLRQTYNAAFTPERYQEMLADIAQQLPGQLDFRVAESPVFVPAALRDKLSAASESIIEVIQQANFQQLTEGAIPPHQRVPGDEGRPDILTFDFAVCRAADGELEPQLIEMQGFPSLYAYQSWIPDIYGKHFPIADTVSPFVEAPDFATYQAEMREFLLGGENPENVILLEIFPEKQKTRIDFALTKEFWDIETVCLTKVRKNGRQLFYEKEGRQIPIRRIYNRVIFDELERYPDLPGEFRLTDDVDVSWVSHPNWFFRVSKYTLPLLSGPYFPPSYFLHELSSYPADLENYVLKPLFSFAGAGVRLHVTAADLDALPDKQHFLLQRKVQYEPVVLSPDGLVKCEIRLLYVWHPGHPKPRLLCGLSRLSRGEMIGVDFNKNKDWVGGSSPMFENE
jgi:hypothetical protein